MNENKACEIVEEAKELDQILSRLNEYYGGVSDLAAKLCDFNDRTQGCIPTTGVDPESPAREGLIGNIFDRLDSLESALLRADSEFRRLSRIG